MQKRNLLVLAPLLSLSLLIAQNGNGAREILDKTYAGYRASDGIRLSFTTSTLNEDGKAMDAQQGEAHIKGDKFKLEMEAMEVWFDGKTQWVFIKEVNEVNISQPTEQEIASISPIALLGMYKNGYSLEKPIETTVNGKNAYRIEMVPGTGSNRDFKSLSVAIDRATHTLVQAILTFSNDLRTQIDITKYNANYHYPDSEFTFNPIDYPGVEIVDLR